MSSATALQPPQTYRRAGAGHHCFAGGSPASGMTVEEILSYTPASPVLAALTILAIYCVKSVVMVIPIAALYISAGILFPPFVAVLLTLLGVFCEAAIGYAVGKKLGRNKVRKLVKNNKKAEQFFAFHENNSVSACFLARILPVPFDLVSLFFGASGMEFWDYIAFSLLGLCPFLIPTVLAGQAIQNPLSREFLIPFAISVLVTVLVFCIFRILRKKYDSNDLEEDRE